MTLLAQNFAAPGRMIRVLALLTDSIGAGGGIAQYNRDWIEAATDAGAQVDLCAFTAQVPAADLLPRGSRLRCATQSRAGLVLSALRSARERTHEIVFCGHLHLAGVAAAAARIAAAPMWLQAHGIEIWDRPGSLRRAASERAELVTSVSRHTRRQILTWLRGDPRRVRVLPNTVGESFTMGSRDVALCRRLGIDGSPVLLTVGRLAAAERYKGHDRVIACLAALAARHPRIQYVIAGDGDDRTRLEALCASCGVSERVRFVGVVAHADLPALYRCADLFVMPSTGEGFGIAYLEAMACGVSALGLGIDGSVDPLADGELGRVSDAANLVPDILSALDSTSGASAMLADRTRTRFSKANFAYQVKRHLLSLVAPRVEAVES